MTGIAIGVGVGPFGGKPQTPRDILGSALVLWLRADLGVTRGTSRPSAAETYALSDGMTLTQDGETATFNTADFVSIGAATAAEVVAVINTDWTLNSATDTTGDFTVSGTGVIGGTARAALGLSANPLVSAWADQSDSGLSFSQATPGNQPPLEPSNANLGGMPTAHFRASLTEELNASSGVPLGTVDDSTWIFVLDVLNTPTNQVLFIGGAAGLGGIIYIESGAAANYGAYDGTAHRLTGTTPAASPGAMAYEWAFDSGGTSCQCKIDNVNEGAAQTYDGTLAINTANTLSLRGYTLQAGNADFKIAEAIGVNRALTAAERTSIYAYISGRYGI